MHDLAQCPFCPHRAHLVSSIRDCLLHIFGLAVKRLFRPKLDGRLPARGPRQALDGHPGQDREVEATGRPPDRHEKSRIFRRLKKAIEADRDATKAEPLSRVRR